MEGVWEVYGRCVEGAQRVHERCAEGVRKKLHGRCVEGDGTKKSGFYVMLIRF